VSWLFVGERMIKPVVVKEVTIGEGVPKILVPLTGSNAEELRRQVDVLPRRSVDVVEWRADYFAALTDTSSVVACGRALSEQLARIPLLFTCRTSAEGGEVAIEDDAYGELNVAVVTSGTVDLVDVEYQRSPAVVERVIAAAHANGVTVIASNHDFAGTPDKDEIINRLRAMQRLGADICKIAVMPRSAADVLTLLDATRTMAEEYADRPLITMSMGGLGVISRLSGAVFGSAASFGMVGTASAPGQLAAEDLYTVMKLLDQAATTPSP
jgi:3-dehydroquinate dehydratase I